MNERRQFRIIDNVVDEKQPYALLDENDTVIRVSASHKALATYAFEFLGAYSVKHDENLLKAEGR